MAKDKQAEHVVAAPQPLEPPTITPAQRQRLQKCYEHAVKLSTQEKKPDYDYAHALFSECVAQDPGNLVYVQGMLDNLERKYERNKKGLRVPSFGSVRTAVRKAAAKREWRDVLALGPDALQSNPWDVPTLRALARACEAFHYNEAELRYLKNALDANPKDIEVNRHCAESLARMGQFDQAIACWDRIEEFGKENDKREAQERISELTIERARGRSGLPGEALPVPKSPVKAAAKLQQVSGQRTVGHGNDGADAQADEPPAPKAPRSTRPPAKKPERAAADEGSEIIASAEQAAALAGDDDLDDEFRRSLERAIADNPADAGSYVLLADLLAERGRFEEAEGLLTRGMAATGKHLAIVERMEDLQIEQTAHRLAIAEKQAVARNTEETQRLALELRRELNKVELAVYRQRVERYPEDRELKFELGLRLKRAGAYEEAVKCFLAVGEEGRLAAPASLEMGEALQHLKRFHDALRQYERAIVLSGAGDAQCRKRALYRAGVLATGMRKLDKAEKLFRALQTLDANYKDLSARLDKIQKIRNSV